MRGAGFIGGKEHRGVCVEYIFLTRGMKDSIRQCRSGFYARRPATNFPQGGGGVYAAARRLFNVCLVLRSRRVVQNSKMAVVAQLVVVTPAVRSYFQCSF
jgi:hypothetical protein